MRLRWGKNCGIQTNGPTDKAFLGVGYYILKYLIFSRAVRNPLHRTSLQMHFLRCFKDTIQKGPKTKFSPLCGCMMLPSHMAVSRCCWRAESQGINQLWDGRCCLGTCDGLQPNEAPVGKNFLPILGEDDGKFNDKGSHPFKKDDIL